MTTNGTYAESRQHVAGSGAANGNGIPPRIIFYTNHGCPYAHRAHITIKELGLPYEEVIIDLNTPRPQWYLDINPRGLVPSIKYSVEGLMDEEIVTESAVVSQFLADAFPSHLLPASHESPTAPLTRARMNFFVDTWNTKIGSYFIAMLKEQKMEDREKKGFEMVAAIEKEIEPLLKDTTKDKPFFGGSKELTFVETQIAPFIMRIDLYCNDDEDLLPSSIKKKWAELPKFNNWANAIMGRESVTYIWDAEKNLEGMKGRVGKFRPKD